VNDRPDPPNYPANQPEIIVQPEGIPLMSKRERVWKLLYWMATFGVLIALWLVGLALGWWRGGALRAIIATVVFIGALGGIGLALLTLWRPVERRWSVPVFAILFPIFLLSFAYRVAAMRWHLPGAVIAEDLALGLAALGFVVVLAKG